MFPPKSSFDFLNVQLNSTERSDFVKCIGLALTSERAVTASKLASRLYFSVGLIRSLRFRSRDDINSEFEFMNFTDAEINFT